MFDRVQIVVKAGKGGNGAVSFRREKFVPLGGPDGGDGGGGGDVIFQADRSLATLKRFRKGMRYRAGNGESGSRQKKHGKSGQDLVISVPVGTTVLPQFPVGDESVIVDLAAHGDRSVIAKGGRGGRGNTRFVSSTSQAPRIAEEGEVGEEMAVILELRLIADVGIIGYPNVGKSSLLAAASAAKPKIAGYPFTTLEPILGVVELEDEADFVLAEIPGLIQGAHLGKGLGHDFLRHVTRTKLLLHLVDGSAEDPLEDLGRVNTELGLYDSALAAKPQVVAVNKMDLPEAAVRRDELQTAFGLVGLEPLFISAATGEGVPELMEVVMGGLKAVEVGGERRLKASRRVFHPRPKDDAVAVHREGDIYVISAPALERLVAGTDISRPDAMGQVRRQMEKRGVARIVERAGVRPGDRVRMGDAEWEW